MVVSVCLAEKVFEDSCKTVSGGCFCIRFCLIIFDEDKKPLEYEITSEGKYSCRDCGMLFDTLKAHDEHHRTVNGQAEAYLNQRMTI